MAKQSTRVVRPPRSARGGIPGWLRFAGGSVLLLISLHFTLVWQMSDLGDEIVEPMTVFANASHRGGYYTWDGDLGIRRLRIESLGGEGYLSIEGLEIDTPSWWWTLKLANPLSARLNRLSDGLGLGSGLGLPHADELHLRLRGIELEVNNLLPPGTPNVSLASAAPFETEGCTRLRYFTSSNLSADLGLAYQRTDLSVGYRVISPEKLLVEFELNSPGVMSTRYEMELKSADASALVNDPDDQQTPEVVALRLILQDQGFIQARNRWCAGQAQIDADEFQRRHITTVRRVLEVYGIRMTPESEAVYSSFAGKGGTLTIESQPPATISGAAFAAYSSEQRWLTLNPRIRLNQEPAVPMTLEFIAPRRLPKAYSGSVWDLLARNADQGGAGASPLDDLGARMRGLGRQEDQADGTAPAPPSAAPKPAPVRPMPVEVKLDTQSLSAVIGQRVEVETMDDKRRVGELLAVDAKTITLRQQVSGGKADLDFSRERIRKITAEPRRPR